MDTTILFYSLAAFVVFIALQMIVFRLTLQDEALRWTEKLYCMCAATLILLLAGDPAVALICFVLFTGFAGVYTLCIFGVIEGSLTLRILSEIALSGKRGISRKVLTGKYNTHEIVKRRIARLLTGGDIEMHKNRYRWKNPRSVYILRERFSDWTKFFFPITKTILRSSKNKRA